MRNIRAHLWVYGLYLALALLITWPLATMLTTHFAGYPFGDAHEMTRHIWWFKRALQTGQPLFFQPLLGYPNGIEGVILWSDPLQFFPAWLLAFVLPLPAAYNVSALLTLALNGWAMYWLLWKLTNSRPAALISGVIFLAAPTIQGHLAGGHGGLLVQWPVPLYIYALLRLSQQSTANTQQPTTMAAHIKAAITQHSSLFTTIFLFALVPTGHTLQLIYLLLPLTGLFALWLLLRREWRAFGRVALAAILGSALLLIFLIPVARATFGATAYTGEGGGADFSMDLLAVITPSFRHPLVSLWDYPRRVLGVNIVEGSSYIGLIAGLLCIAAVWKQRAARGWLVVALIAWMLALGPLLKAFDQPVTVTIDGYTSFIPLPWALVQDWPGFTLARTPARFNFLLAAAVAIMAGYGTAALLKAKSSHQRIRYGIVVILIGGILFEYQSFWPLPTFSASIPEPVRDLAGRADVRAVLDVPWNDLLAAKDALWLQTGHEKPLIGGHVTRRTPVSPAKLTLLQETLDPALLKAAGADVVIVHRRTGAGKTLTKLAQTQLGEPLYQDNQIAVFNVPEAGEAAFVAFNAPDGDVKISADSYVYAPQSGWVNFTGTLRADDRAVTLLLDGTAVQRWHIRGEQALDLRLPLTTEGYHTISLALNPACPDHYDSALECRALTTTNLALNDFQPGSFANPVQFDRGIQLAASHLPSQASSALSLDLYWRFDQARSEQDIRFVHVLDAAGKLVAQSDQTLGAQPAGSNWIERVTIPVPDIPPGEYHVEVGWYAYPDTTPFCVVEAGSCKPGAAALGSFMLSKP
jgi:hypothetical protein